MSNRVNYTFQLRDGWSAAAQRIKQSVSGLKRHFQSMAAGIKRSMASVRRSVNSGVGNFVSKMKYAAAATGVVATKVGADFQTAMADLSAITGAAGDDLAYYRSEARKLAKETATDQAAIVRTIKMVASGKAELLDDPKKLMEVTRAVMTLKTAANITAEQSASTLVTTLNQFNLAADQVDRVINVLAAGSKFGAAEVDRIAPMLVAFGALTETAHMSLEESVAATEILAKKGLKTDVAGTGMKMILLRLAGFKKKEFDVEKVGLAQALKNLKQSNIWKNTAKMKKIFGDEAIIVAKTLLDQIDGFEKMTKDITGTQIAHAQAATNMATFNMDLTKAWVHIKDRMISAFLQVSPDLRVLLSNIQKWADSITNEDIAAVVSVLKQLGNAMLTLLKSVRDLGRWIGETLGKYAVSYDKGGALGVVKQGLSDASNRGVFGNVIRGASSLWNRATGVQAVNTRSRVDMNVNLNDPGNYVQNLSTNAMGPVTLNTGYNMMPGGL